MGSQPVIEMERSSIGDREAIDQQVQRMLQHPLFNRSERLPAFLRYIVDKSLSMGSEGAVKERTLGIELFGRKPDYDNAADPIVRVTASELRKKLAQYYYEDGHRDEIRIDLPPGAYLPRFRRAATGDVVVAEQEVEKPQTVVEEAKTNAIGLPSPLPQDDSAVESTPLMVPIRWIGWSIASVLIAVVAFYAIRTWRQSQTIDGFWTQFSSASDHAFIVMPVIGSDDINVATTGLRNVSARPALSLEDTNMAVRLAGQLERHGLKYQLVSSPDVTLDQLRTGPSVLIGALDNVWTMRLSKELPFGFEEASDNKTGRIVEKDSVNHASWSVDIDKPHTRISRDYGIVARYHDRLTGGTAVIVAGISSQGTQAAGELLTTSEYESLRATAKSARNFEVVIETEAVDGHSGPPRIVASKTW